MTATVQWDAGKTADLSNMVPATILWDTWDVVKNGSYDSQTGLVTHKGKSYRFRFVVVQDVPSMQPY